VLQRDVKGLFPSYAEACRRADALLFSIGKTEAVSAACAASPVGKLLPDALYVHSDALGRLPPELRVLEGCARAYIGRVEGANLVKLNRIEPKVGYLSYPDSRPIPPGAGPVTVRPSPDVPRAHAGLRGQPQPAGPATARRPSWRPTHPLRPKFERLTKAEEARGSSTRAAGSAPATAGSGAAGGAEEMAAEEQARPALGTRLDARRRTGRWCSPSL
jgi:DNA phosphorothioation-associated putative methyltransferase